MTTNEPPDGLETKAVPGNYVGASVYNPAEGTITESAPVPPRGDQGGIVGPGSIPDDNSNSSDTDGSIPDDSDTDGSDPT